jgi:hypothetical protein
MLESDCVNLTGIFFHATNLVVLCQEFVIIFISNLSFINQLPKRDWSFLLPKMKTIRILNLRCLIEFVLDKVNLLFRRNFMDFWSSEKFIVWTVWKWANDVSSKSYLGFGPKIVDTDTRTNITSSGVRDIFQSHLGRNIIKVFFSKLVKGVVVHGHSFLNGRLANIGVIHTGFVHLQVVLFDFKILIKTRTVRPFITF